MTTAVRGACGAPPASNERNEPDRSSCQSFTSSRRYDLRTYSIKIPPGLRALLNDITQEVLCSKEDLQRETEIYRFCAEFMETLLAQRNPALRTKMIPANIHSAPNRNDCFTSYNREGTFHLTNTDSDSGMDEIYTTDAGTTDAEDTLSVESALQKLADAALSDPEDSMAAPDVVKGFNQLSGKVAQPSQELHDQTKRQPLLKPGTIGLGKVSQDWHGTTGPINQTGHEENEIPSDQNDDHLHCLELEFTLDNHKVSKNKGSTRRLLLATDNHDQTLLARVDLLVSRKNVQILPREDKDGSIVKSSRIETDVKSLQSHSKIPIELIQQSPEGGTCFEIPTPIHSINSATSDLPPSPTSLKSWTSGHRAGEEGQSEALYSSEPKDISGTSGTEHSPEEHGPRTGTIRVWLPSESLAVAGLPSSGTKEGSLAKRECEDLLGASQSGHQFIVAKGGGGETKATSPHANSLDHQGHAGIAGIPGAVKETSSSLEVAVQTELTYPLGEPGEPKGSLLSSRPHEKEEEGSLEKESVVLSQLSNESRGPPTFPSFENVTTQTEAVTLSQVSTQTPNDQDIHFAHEDSQELSKVKKINSDCVQDCLTARVLLEHIGTVFSPTDSQEAVNYLDLSRLGEEGETPGSDEIWLAVDGDEEKGFLTSTEEDPDSLSVETDKLSAIATMAGRLSTDSVTADTPSEIDSMGMGNNNNNLDAMKKDGPGFGEFSEMYANLTQRLQSILNQELDPIQDTLDHTGKNLNNLTEKLLQMETLLTTLCDSMQKVSSELQASQNITGTVSHSSRPLGDMRNASEKSLDQIVSKIENLSVELGQADTANQLREDNHQLRRDLNLFRNRERHLIERIESMEKLLHKSSVEIVHGSGSRSASRRGSQTSDSELPPIEKVQTKKATKKDPDESADPITKQSLLQGGPKPSKKLLARRGSHERIKSYQVAHGIDIDAIHTEIQVARSDNVILRQDLQVCRDREHQLVYRNKELEDKLLCQAKAVRTDSTHNHAKKHLSTAPTITNTILPRAEIDINIDFTPPGRAIIKERPSYGPPALNQATIETIAPLEQETLGEKPLKKVHGLKTSEVNTKKMKDDRKKMENVQGKKSTNISTQRASFEVQDWKVNINSAHDLEVSQDGQKAVIVTPKIEEELKEAVVQQAPEVSGEAQPIVPLKLNKTKAEVKSEPKLKSPPKSFIPTTATSKKEEPVTKPIAHIQEVKKERVRPVKVVRKPPPQQQTPIEIHDPRADPIPKPAQFPCARPPRDYVPGRNYQKRTSVADILSHESANHSFTTLSKSNNHSSRELIHSGPELVQMFIKEEPAELCDSGVPVCQARESPDGANSSVMNGGSTSKCSGRISVNLYDQVDEREVAPEPSPHDVILEYVLKEESELRDQEKQKRRDAFWGDKRRPAIIRRPKNRSRSLSQEKSKARRLRQKHTSVERLPTLSAFDEERIVWMKNYENESTREDERRRRALVRRATAQTLQSAMNEIDFSSNSTNSNSEESTSEMKSKTHQIQVPLACNPQEEQEPGMKNPESANNNNNNNEVMIPKKKTSRKQWDTDKIICDSERPRLEQDTFALVTDSARHTHSQDQVKENENMKNRITDASLPSNNPLMSAECFIVSRGWQMDQSKLLRALDRIKCANFSRVQIATTINRVVENVRPNLDIVVIHIGNQELLEASLSIGKSEESVHNVAGSVATVMSRQIIKVAQQNKSTQFLISCPLSKGSETKHITLEETQIYSGLRKVFNATLKANCSSFFNIQCSENDNLTEMEPDDGLSRESRYFSDSLQLNSAGMRKLARNWESYLRRITRANDGELVLRLSSSDSGSNSSAGTTRNMADRGDQMKVPWKPY